MTAPKKTDPLTAQEVSTAAEIFFELFDIVLAQAPEGTSIEDAIKLSESIFAYAHKLRAIDAKENTSAPFGFNKGGSEEPLSVSLAEATVKAFDHLPISDVRRWTHV